MEGVPCSFCNLDDSEAGDFSVPSDCGACSCCISLWFCWVDVWIAGFGTLSCFTPHENGIVEIRATAKKTATFFMNTTFWIRFENKGKVFHLFVVKSSFFI